MRVDDVMQTPARTVPADASLADAVAAMLDDGVDCVIAETTDPSRKVGVLTETDVLVAICADGDRYAANGRLAATLDAIRGIEPTTALEATTVDDALRQPVVRIDPSCNLRDAARRLRQEAVSHLVVSKHLTLQGTVTHADIGRHLEDVIRERRTIDTRRPDWERNS